MFRGGVAKATAASRGSIPRAVHRNLLPPFPCRRARRGREKKGNSQCLEGSQPARGPEQAGRERGQRVGAEIQLLKAFQSIESIFRERGYHIPLQRPAQNDKLAGCAIGRREKKCCRASDGSGEAAAFHPPTTCVSQHDQTATTIIT